MARVHGGGPTAAGTVQLDWIGDVGAFPGHSGGPVIDADGHALVGILVEGSEPARFDRFMPITQIARVWPQLPRPWLMTGSDASDTARSHFMRGAHWRFTVTDGEDLFCGRRNALDCIHSWLTADKAPMRALVITGSPGEGKSAVIGRSALRVEAQNVGPGLAYYARGATIPAFLAALADWAGIDTPRLIHELIESLANLPKEPPTCVVLDALDEAASDDDRRQIARVLAEMASLPALRIAVTTRPLAVGNPYAPDGLLGVLGITAPDRPNLVDLDTDSRGQQADPANCGRFPRLPRACAGALRSRLALLRGEFRIRAESIGPG